MSKKLDEIDLHSKEVQDIMGRMPSWLIRNGMVMVVLLLIVLIAGTWFFKYPDIISAPVVVVATVDSGKETSLTGYVQLQRSSAREIKIGQQVNLKFANYPYLEYGSVRGFITKISAVPTGDSYTAEVKLPDQMISTFGKNLVFQSELKGTAEIITEDQRLLSRILSPVKRVFSYRPAQ
ncbi:MAG: hypothetical protein WCP08_02290 [Prolixibacteraceae bacterium]